MISHNLGVPRNLAREKDTLAKSTIEPPIPSRSFDDQLGIQVYSEEKHSVLGSNLYTGQYNYM